jgi:hypothetical protein
MTWERAAELAQIITASIALVGVVIAVISILDQRNIARRRAAIDFFLKTQMDDTVVELYNDFRRIAPGIVSVASSAASMENFVGTTDHTRVRAFLNVCELIAVGINEHVLSERVCYAYWGDALPWSYQAAEPLIKYIRTKPGEGTPSTYLDLERIAKKWARWNSRQRARQ